MTKSINDYTNPFDALAELEKGLKEFTGAPFVAVTDSVLHAIEVGLRYRKPKMYATIPAQTKPGVTTLLEDLGISYLTDDEGQDENYQIKGSLVYDHSGHFERGMFARNPGQTKILCVSLEGGGGALLTDNREAYQYARSVIDDGRIKERTPGLETYEYGMLPENAVTVLNALSEQLVTSNED